MKKEAPRLGARRCAECGSRKSCDVHHVRYRCIWHVDPAADLEWRCPDCHDAEH